MELVVADLVAESTDAIEFEFGIVFVVVVVVVMMVLLKNHLISLVLAQNVPLLHKYVFRVNYTWWSTCIL